MTSSYGLVYGQLIGDALGGRYEFKSSKEVMIQTYKDAVKEPYPTLPILGGGPFNLAPGQVTDDSELALVLLESLARNGTYNREDVVKGYKSWLESDPFDIGNATLAAFINANSYDEMVANSLRRDKAGNPSMSNGSLMRISPLALLIHKDHSRDSIWYTAGQDAMITHSSPEVFDATKVYVNMLVDLLEGKKTKEEVVDDARWSANTSLVRDIIINATTTPASNGVILPSRETVKPDGEYAGYFGIALANAIYQLLHGRSFFKSLVDTVRLGGDTDTNAAIAGALLGSYYGVNGIPSTWIDSVNNPNITNRAKNPPVQQKDVLRLIKALYQ